MPCGSFRRTSSGVMNGPMTEFVLGGLNWKNGAPVGPSEGWLTAVKQVSAKTRNWTQRLTDLEIGSALSGYPAATLPLPAAWLPCGRNRSDPSSA